MAFALVYASCSNDEIIEQRQANEITYAPAVAMPTRGVTTTANIEEFVVDGYLTTDTETKLYINNNMIERQGDQWISKDNAPHFWPYTGSIDFYAYSPVDTKDKVVYSEEMGERKAVIQNFEVNTQSSDFKDLLYAVTPKRSHAVGSDLMPVPINFKHALSQIAFNIKNTNPALVIDVDKISIVNLASKGTFTLPTDYTELSGGPEGTWALANKIAGGKTYDAYISAVSDITPASGTINLSANGAMLLLPQKATAWDPKNDAENESFGSYVLVNCRVWAINAGEKMLLWPQTNNTAGEIIYREVAIPIDIDWKPGKRYTYTLVFGEGAGYIPPSSTDPGEEVNLTIGDKVLKPITYNVTVDEFTTTPDIPVPSIK